jgi:RNA polymerase sigma-70 factor (ECF subfamily)
MGELMNATPCTPDAGPEPAVSAATDGAGAEPRRQPTDVEALYRRYGPMVLRRCRRMLGDDERAADAMQDVFVQVLRYADRLDTTAPSSLLYRIATNVCLNRIRASVRRREDAKESLIEEIARVAPDEPRSQARLTLDRLLGRELDASTAEIAVMYWVDDMTHDEVAREVGLSVSGVRKRLRALQSRVAQKHRELAAA